MKKNTPNIYDETSQIFNTKYLGTEADSIMMRSNFSKKLLKPNKLSFDKCNLKMQRSYTKPPLYMYTGIDFAES